jgi:hypothetical protein
MRDPPTRFTDQQMALILKRAAELQATGEEPIHTLEAIQQIADQVGIDRGLVAEAAAAVSAPGAGAGPLLFGPPSSFRVTRQVAGALGAADQPLLIAAIRDHLPEVGHVTAVAGGFEWHGGSSDDKTAVTFTSSPTGTTIRVDRRRFAPKFGLFMGAGSLTMLATVAGLGVSPIVSAGLGLGTFVLSFSAARFVWDRMARGGRQRIDRLLVELSDRLDRT